MTSGAPEGGSGALVWVTGASEGIGRALVETVPFRPCRVIGVSRTLRRRWALAGGVRAHHLRADLSGPSGWAAVAASLEEGLPARCRGPVVFVHAAATLDPIAFAAEADPKAYEAAVLLDSAAPQVLGQAFLRAAAGLEASRHLVVLTSGAARSVYPGWSAYGAGKAAVDQWVRTVAAEQERRGGVRVLAVAPGVVDTAMQARIRAASEADFPRRGRFAALAEAGALAEPRAVAERIWALLERDPPLTGVVDLRELGPED
jgi:benzil reductase ((S)-benzoin forming)